MILKDLLKGNIYSLHLKLLHCLRLPFNMWNVSFWYFILLGVFDKARIDIYNRMIWTFDTKIHTDEEFMSLHSEQLSLMKNNRYTKPTELQTSQIVSLVHKFQ